MAACGCYAQTHTPEACRSWASTSSAAPATGWSFWTLLEQAGGGARSRRGAWTTPCAAATFEVLPAGGMAARTRAMLKVEDGCVNFCTYCIIPYARGPVRSLPLEEAVRQAGAAAAGGLPGDGASPASRSPLGDRICKDGRSLIDLLEAVCAGGGERCACGWAVWSPAP